MTLIDQTETSAPLQALLDGRLLDFPDHLLDILPVGVYVCDRAGLLVRYNRAAAELWGCSQVGDGSSLLWLLSPYDLDGRHVPHANVPWPTSSQPARHYATGDRDRAAGWNARCGARDIEAIKADSGRRWGGQRLPRKAGATFRSASSAEADATQTNFCKPCRRRTRRRGWADYTTMRLPRSVGIPPATRHK